MTLNILKQPKRGDVIVSKHLSEPDSWFEEIVIEAREDYLLTSERSGINCGCTSAHMYNLNDKINKHQICKIGTVKIKKETCKDRRGNVIESGDILYTISYKGVISYIYVLAIFNNKLHTNFLMDCNTLNNCMTYRSLGMHTNACEYLTKTKCQLSLDWLLFRKKRRSY